MTTISRSALGLTEAPPQPSQQAVEVAPLANLGEICFTDPARLDLCVYRGDSGRIRVTVTGAGGAPVNISGATWDCDIRKTVDAATTAGSMTVTPVAGITNAVDVTLTAAVSATLNDPPYVWDLEMRISGEVTTILAGDFTVTRDVSRP